RSRPTKFRGRIWVHSSLALGLRDWSEIVGGPAVPLAEGVRLDDGTELPALDALPQGAILGSVEIVGCQRFADMPRRDRDDPFAEGPVCWMLRDPQPLARPV